MRGLGLSVWRFARRPGRGAAAALTLAVGIGATTAAFAAVDVVLLRDLPVDREKELVVGWRMDEERTSIPVPFRTEEYEFLSRGQRRLAGFTAWSALPVLVENSATGYTLNEVRVAGDFFGVAGIRPAIGRHLTADDDRPGVAQVGVLSHRTWRTLFGSDPEVIGSSLSMRGRAVTVVGVGPPGFDFPLGTDLWVPLQGEPFELHVIGRTVPGALRLRLHRTPRSSKASATASPSGLRLLANPPSIETGCARPGDQGPRAASSVSSQR